MDKRDVGGSGSSTDGTVEIPAALSPAEAGRVRDLLLEHLMARGGEGLTIEIDADVALPCALQMLVAAERSAEAQGVSCRLGPRAEQARAALTLEQPQE